MRDLLTFEVKSVVGGNSVPESNPPTQRVRPPNPYIDFKDLENPDSYDTLLPDDR